MRQFSASTQCCVTANSYPGGSTALDMSGKFPKPSKSSDVKEVKAGEYRKSPLLPTARKRKMKEWYRRKSEFSIEFYQKLLRFFFTFSILRSFFVETCKNFSTYFSELNVPVTIFSENIVLHSWTNCSGFVQWLAPAPNPLRSRVEPFLFWLSPHDLSYL